jgi:hypothetical protein
VLTIIASETAPASGVVPFSDALSAAVAQGASLTEAWLRAAAVAEQAAQVSG